MTIGDRIRHLREKSGLTQTDVAKKLNIATQTIFKYEKNIVTNIPMENVERLAGIFGVSPSYLMGWEDDIPVKKELPTPNSTSDFVTFPVIGEIAAGYDSLALEDWNGETVDIPSSYFKGRDKSEFFVLEVKGDSMYPEYQEGDRVLILKQSTLEYSGQIGAVLYEDTHSTLKKVEYAQGQDWMKLIPINPSFKPQRIEGEALEHCKVIGIPRMLIRDIKNS